MRDLIERISNYDFQGRRHTKVVFINGSSICSCGWSWRELEIPNLRQ